jgi:GT2 family glycosyltransferase
MVAANPQEPAEQSLGHGGVGLDNSPGDEIQTSLRRGRFAGDTLSFEPTSGAVMQGVTVVVCTHGRAVSLRRLLDSIAGQARRPDSLIIVDASSDDRSERVIVQHPTPELLADDVVYVRVSGSRRGLTRQRNFALRLARTDLVAFFDDDTVLLPGCLGEMERPLRLTERVVGVAGYIENEPRRPTPRWWLRLRARVVPSLQPGRYFRSGTSTPWGFLPPTTGWIEGDWLPGCASMWRTAAARDVGFNEGFVRYCSGEDLEFSLRMKEKGRLVVAGRARLLHLQDPGGRLDPFELGFMTVRNHYYIHRHCVADRTWLDAAWFQYGCVVDALWQAISLLLPGERRVRWGYLKGYSAGMLSMLVRPPALERKGPDRERRTVA